MVLEPKPGFELRGKEVDTSFFSQPAATTALSLSSPSSYPFTASRHRSSVLYATAAHHSSTEFVPPLYNSLSLSLSLSLFKSVKTLMPEIDAFRVSRRISCKIGSRFC
ncbi:hypothetical protein ACOSQ3_006218 [Xanthoceras sorbifolium]